jgi:ATP-dependent DNA helicase PIF1
MALSAEEQQGVAEMMCHAAGVGDVQRPDGKPVDWCRVLAGHQESEATRKAIMQAVQDGHSVFVTGPGGVGKTALLNDMRKKFGTRKVAVCATTGMAALLVNGTTLHRFAGAGLAKETAEDLLAKMRVNAKAKWRATDVLIIDEVSMLDPAFFAKLDFFGRALRTHPEKPFGGIQIVAFGDFYQLPPVDTRRRDASRFVFQSVEWENAIDYVFEMRHVYRQTDQLYGDILGRVRVGRATEEDELILRTRLNAKLECEDEGIIPTRLMPRNAQVDAFNAARLAELPGDVVSFEARVFVPSAIEKYDRAKRDAVKTCPVPEKLDLKVGAQVMLCVNHPVKRALVNGSRGVVVRFARADGNEAVVVKFVGGEEETIEYKEWMHDAVYSDDGLRFDLSYQQIPLRLAFGVTIHKCQGATLDAATADLGTNIFAPGQAYVALSRVRSLMSLSLVSFDPGSICANPLVTSYMDYIRRHGTHRGWRASVNTIRFPSAAEIKAMAARYQPPQRPHDAAATAARAAMDMAAQRARADGKDEDETEREAKRPRPAGSA